MTTTKHRQRRLELLDEMYGLIDKIEAIDIDERLKEPLDESASRAIRQSLDDAARRVLSDHPEWDARLLVCLCARLIEAAQENDGLKNNFRADLLSAEARATT